jgi:hypothetical protein
VAKSGEGALADIGVEGVELVGECAADGFGGVDELVQVAIALG